ncbi:MAG: peptidylprolyl isomerase [Thermoanaerobaculia bacterium]|nr:peptidylprolyl isomerase [Thermoanaerobaculia bacterium]
MSAALVVVLAAAVAFAQTLPRVVVATEVGDIELEIDVVRAPVTAANFLRYVDAGLYRDTSFYRVVDLDNDPEKEVKIRVIQGGRGEAAEITGFAPIAHETTIASGLRHRDGVVSMARLEPGTASSEIFICLGDQPELDHGGRRNPDGQGFAAFGRVVKGRDVVRRIHGSRREGQTLSPGIRIHGIRRAGGAAR